MAKKVFKVDENATAPAQGMLSAEETVNATASVNESAEPVVEAVSEQHTMPDKSEKKRAKKQKKSEAKQPSYNPADSATTEEVEAAVIYSESKNTDTHSAQKTDSRARTVSDRYAADLIVKNLLNKGGELSKNKELQVGKKFAPSAKTDLEMLPEAEAPESEKADTRIGKSNNSAKSAPEYAAEKIEFSETSEPRTEKAADNIYSETKESKKDQSAEKGAAKKSRAKEVSDRYSADLIISSVLKGEASPPAVVPKPKADDSEAPKTKKIFKSAPDGDSSPADLGTVDQLPKSDKVQPAEKPSAKKTVKEIVPAAVSEKKQPRTFVSVLKTIYRVTVTTIKVLLLTVPFLAVIAYTNMNVDPGRLYHIDREDMFEYDIVRLMKEGHNVENIKNYNERLVKREYINQMEEPADVIIAGSSRGALITKEMLNVDSMFNTSVAGGSLDDVIGFYGVLHQYDLLPKTYIIVLDPWMLNDNHYDNRYERSIGDGYYHYMTSRMGYNAVESLKEIDSIYEPGSDEPISFWDLSDDVKWNLISITYFQASIQRYFGESAIVRPDTWPVATDSEDGESAFLRPDGSFCYPLSYRSASADKASSRARMSFPESIIGLEDYSVLESNRKQIFIDFLKCVQEDGVEVKIVVEPISNVIVEYMKVFERYENFFKAEEVVYGIAASLGIEITGSFDPEKLEYDMNCFYDGYHLREQYIEEIVRPFKQ